MPALENTRHEKFAQLVASGNSKTAAHREACGTDGKTANEGGCRLAMKDKVRARIQELREIAAAATAQRESAVAAEVAEKFRGTVLTLARKRALLREHAERKDIETRDLVAVVIADAKLAGELTEKFETKETFEKEPLEVLRQRFKEAQAKRKIHGLQ